MGNIRLLLAFIMSNAVAALCQLINAVIIYVQLVSNRMISDRLYQSMLLICVQTVSGASLTRKGLYIDSTFMPAHLLLGPSGVSPKGIDERS